MLKKTIEYTDFNGVLCSEEFYFNLTKAELVEIELSTKGGFAETLQAIVKSDDGKAIIEKFKEIICMAYGVRSEDGKRFIKSPEISKDFTQTEAYSVLFVELATDAEASTAFINALVPADLASQRFPAGEYPQSTQMSHRAPGRPQPQDHLQAQPRTVMAPAMPQDKFNELLRDDPQVQELQVVAEPADPEGQDVSYGEIPPGADETLKPWLPKHEQNFTD